MSSLIQGTHYNNMDRTNIIDDSEVARAMALATQGKKKQVKSKKTAVDGRASGPKVTKKPGGPTTNARAKAAHTTITNHEPRGGFYEANGLKIPLYNNDGSGTKKRQCARLAKSLLNKSVNDLLDIIEQYAGADKRQELMNKGLSKLKLATWIEEKETLALGRNPKSTLPNINQNRTNNVVRPVNPVPPTLVQEAKNPAAQSPITYVPRNGPKTAKKDGPVRERLDNQKRGPPDEALGNQLQQKHQRRENEANKNTTPVTDVKGNVQQIATTDRRVQEQLGSRKRGLPDGTPGSPSPHKHQKREREANNGTTRPGKLEMETPVDKPVNEAIPQTGPRVNIFRGTEIALHHRGIFMDRLGLDSNNPDRSSLILRGDKEHHVITTVSKSPNGSVYLFDTTITNDKRDAPITTRVPFRKPGNHGRHGDFIDDPDRFTGRGHQMEPVDATRWQKYKSFQNKLEQDRRHNPTKDRGEAINHRTEGRWNEWQNWYGGFLERYPGYAVAHLWPCGCEVMGDGNESEEE
ncbi:nad(P)-binding protein [Pyrenophora seminiperda CCB06]|uniref:Nad(P)-binding protein n=1 Tax=Pyrenophora seminiperda CCB06 TaxID=1302712 RepID=A0A3M7MB01_9PLEO|nr:nad(P)-binding protein [Pyrenophora seminiperda CCB06]